jgi:hypothetical protein
MDEWSDVKLEGEVPAHGGSDDRCDREVLPRIGTRGGDRLDATLSRGLQLTAATRPLRKRGEGQGPIERELTLAQGGGGFSCLIRFSI